MKFRFLDMDKISLLLALFGLTGSIACGSYLPPKEDIANASFKVRCEPGLVKENDSTVQLLMSTARQFAQLQKANSSSGVFVPNGEAVKIAAKVVRDSTRGFISKDVEVEQLLIAEGITPSGDFSGFAKLPFPEVHIWSKSTLKALFANSSNPPWLTLDAERSTLEQRFMKEDDTFFPLVIVIDTSLSPEEQKERTVGFLHFWLKSMDATSQMFTSASVFGAVSNVTKPIVLDKRLPGWFAIGLSYRIAFVATSQLLGERAARDAVEAILGPKPNATDLKVSARSMFADFEKEISRADRRVAYELLSEAQNSSANNFVRLILADATQAKTMLSPTRVRQIYQSVAKTNTALLDY